jgi:hypothetical protein
MLRNAVVAIDTDTTFMSKRFSGNTAQATAWIADLFAQENVMYKRDLDVHLQQGATFLRIASDPFAKADTSATSAQLNEVGSYWQTIYRSGGTAVPATSLDTISARGIPIAATRAQAVPSA